MRRPRAIAALTAIVAAGAIALFGAGASADTSVWARARRPELSRHRDLIVQAEELQHRHRKLTTGRREERDMALGRDYLRQAAALLELAGASKTRDPRLKLRLATAYHQLGEVDKATRLLDTIVRASPAPPAPVLAEAWSELAVCLARLGRHTEEITAYGRALSLEPHPHARATLLANRAEAYMVLGDISSAVDGYRAALALLASPTEMLRFGPTTLWGLAVALDRSGDLDSGLEAIRLARTYDRRDDRINNNDTWFYVPPYDRYWYEALGHWAVARKTDSGAVRASAYAHAVASWEEYITKAAPDDKWIAIARARHRLCQKEREAARKASLQKKAPPGDETADAE